MALYVNRDTLELLGRMMPHLCGPSRPAASIVVALRDAEFFWRSCNKQYGQYCRNQATLNIQMAKCFLTEKARQEDW